MPYLVDGNNLLGSWGGPRSGEDRRQEVVRRVSAFCRSRGAKAVLVFDGRPLRDDRDTQSFGGVSVRFPPPGVDADTVIRKLIDSSSQPGDIVVVTSDKPLYSYARTRGARAMTAREWNQLERSAPASSASPGSEKPDREDDVEGWLARFERRS